MSLIKSLFPSYSHYTVSCVKDSISDLTHQISFYCTYTPLFPILQRNMVTDISHTFNMNHLQHDCGLRKMKSTRTPIPTRMSNNFHGLTSTHIPTHIPLLLYLHTISSLIQTLNLIPLTWNFSEHRFCLWSLVPPLSSRPTTTCRLRLVIILVDWLRLLVNLLLLQHRLRLD